MAVVKILVQSYATNVYILGTNTLANILATKGQEYVNAVMKLAAEKYYIDQIDAALMAGYITQQEWADTLALKTPNDPQYDPTALMRAESTEATAE